jgi:hypothetical protein
MRLFKKTAKAREKWRKRKVETNQASREQIRDTQTVRGARTHIPEGGRCGEQLQKQKRRR